MQYVIEIFIPSTEQWVEYYRYDHYDDADAMIYAMHKSGMPARIKGGGIMYRVQYWSRNDNNWVQHSVNDTRTRAMKELFYLESCDKIVRIIYEGRIIAETYNCFESEDSCELPY